MALNLIAFVTCAGDPVHINPAQVAVVEPSSDGKTAYVVTLSKTYKVQGTAEEVARMLQKRML